MNNKKQPQNGCHTVFVRPADGNKPMGSHLASQHCKSPKYMDL